MCDVAIELDSLKGWINPFRHPMFKIMGVLSQFSRSGLYPIHVVVAQEFRSHEDHFKRPILFIPDISM